MNPAIIMALATVAAPMISKMMGGQGESEKRSSTFNPQQQSTLSRAMDSIRGMRGGADITQNPAYGQGMEWMQSLFNDPEFFNKFEAPMQRQYEEQTIPDLANRFASMGSGGSLGSTGFRNQLAREGSNLQTNMAAQRGQMQQAAIPQMLGYAQQPASNYNQLLGITTGQGTLNQYQGPTPGWGGNMMAGLSGGLSQGLGQYAGQYMAGMGNQSAPSAPSAQAGGGGSLYRGYPGQSPTTY